LRILGALYAIGGICSSCGSEEIPRPMTTAPAVVNHDMTAMTIDSGQVLSTDAGTGSSDAGLEVDAGPADAGSSPSDGGKADAGSMPPSRAPFECTQFLGPNVTGEWFAAGFERYVDESKWQVKAPHRSFVDFWADPNHPVWRETNCAPDFSPCETRSKCPAGKGPDRIVFVTQQQNYQGTSQADWEKSISAAIQTIKTKYPTVRHVQLMTFVRGPQNASCGNETVVSPNLDRAHEALASASAGSISVAPRFEVPNCNLFGSAPHFTNAGNAAMAQIIGKHYAQEK
jgi:hypothetical protein